MIANAQYTMSVISNVGYYKSMNDTQTDALEESGGIARAKIPEFVKEQRETIRAMKHMTSIAMMSLGELGVLNGTSQATVMMRDALMMMTATTGIYSAVKAMYMARTAYENTVAMAEAAAAAIAQNWYGLAIAGAAAAAVYATFSYVSHADVSTPIGRREVESTMRAVSASG